jgi:hypothetical protein
MPQSPIARVIIKSKNIFQGGIEADMGKCTFISNCKKKRFGSRKTKNIPCIFAVISFSSSHP